MKNLAVLFLLVPVTYQQAVDWYNEVLVKVGLERRANERRAITIEETVKEFSKLENVSATDAADFEFARDKASGWLIQAVADGGNARRSINTAYKLLQQHATTGVGAEASYDASTQSAKYLEAAALSRAESTKYIKTMRGILFKYAK